MSSRRPLIITALLLVVVLALGVVVYYQTKNMDWYRPKIINTLQRITGHQVSIKQVSYAPLSGLFSLELLELEILPEDPAEPPMVQVQETLLSFNPISLFVGKPQLSAIKFINPQIHMVLRDKAPLLERAQDTAVAGDEKLTSELGVGLDELTIGRITVQNGILVVLDWDHPEGRTLVFDHLHVGVHALSPMRASPINASARYRSVPFTVHGQIGPLPSTFDPFDMPILLSFEAKSVRLKDLQEILSTDTVQVKTSRGYFSTLLHGSLDQGLQTSTWLQLDGVSLRRKDEKAKTVPAQQLNTTILDRFNLRSDKKDTLDISFRQKSTIIIDLDGIPNLEFEEFFVYLDGSPVLAADGWIRNQLRGPLKLDLKILNQVDLDRFPWPESFPFSGNSPSGTFGVAGVWPKAMVYSAEVDLSNTTVHAPPLDKKSGVPLALELLVSQSNNELTIKKFALKHPIIPDHNITVSGSFAPNKQLETNINWSLERLSDYLPVAKNWNSQGLAKLNMMVTQSLDSADWHAKGAVDFNKGKIGPLEFKELELPFELVENRLHLPHMKMLAAGGLVEMMALVDLSQEPIIFDAQLALAGVDVGQLPGQSEGHAKVQLEGNLFAGANIYGQLDSKSYLPIGELLGHSYLRVEPGRLTSINHNAFYKPVIGNMVISDDKNALYWNKMETNLTILQKKLIFENIQVDTSNTNISGSGTWELNGAKSFSLDIQTDLDLPLKEQKRFSVVVAGDKASNQFSMEQKVLKSK
ncbi:MAG: DUF748 domain-containing protein [Magnetococcales bacterium]|nr:DUF748 domain-containing protein [Magnetococcales bacterium]